MCLVALVSDLRPRKGGPMLSAVQRSGCRCAARGLALGLLQCPTGPCTQIYIYIYMSIADTLLLKYLYRDYFKAKVSAIRHMDPEGCMPKPLPGRRTRNILHWLNARSSPPKACSRFFSTLLLLGFWLKKSFGFRVLV